MTDTAREGRPAGQQDQSAVRRRLAFGIRPALIVIDFVKAYLLEDSPLYGGSGIQAALQGAIDLLTAARRVAIPIVHTNVAYDEDGLNGGVFFRKLPALRCFAAGADHPERRDFADGLVPAPGETVITKQYASAFFGTSLASTLTALRVDTLLIAGVSTSGCVRATGVDCCQHGFVPIIVREAVGDRAPGPHDANLFDLQAKYGEVVSLSDALAYLGRQARTLPEASPRGSPAD